MLTTFDLIIFLKNLAMVSSYKCIHFFRILLDFVHVGCTCFGVMISNCQKIKLGQFFFFFKIEA